MSESQVRSRRALLAGAVGGGAAIAASAALPMSRALAVDEPLLMNVGNSASGATSLTAALNMDTVFGVTNSDAGPNTAIQGSSDGGTAIAGYTATGTGLYGDAMGSGRGVRGGSGTAGTGVYGVGGDDSGAPSDTSFTGVFGFSEPGNGTTTFGAGVWGVSDDFGVYGSGGIGVFGDGGTSGTGIEGYSASGYGLYVTGKVRLANRSGRLAVAAGKTSISKSVTGMTSTNIVIAVLQTPETGTWVRAAVASAGKFTVYFNRALPTSSVVGWVVLN